MEAHHACMHAGCGVGGVIKVSPRKKGLREAIDWVASCVGRGED